MSEGKVWRRFITIWVAAVCLIALDCCWMLRPYPYAFARHAYVLDKRTGLLGHQVGVLVTKISTNGGEVFTNTRTQDEWDALQKATEAKTTPVFQPKT